MEEITEMKHRTDSGFDADAIDHTTAADLAEVGSDKWTRYPAASAHSSPKWTTA